MAAKGLRRVRIGAGAACSGYLAGAAYTTEFSGERSEPAGTTG